VIQGADAEDVITVRTDRNITRSIRRCDGKGADMTTIEPEPKRNASG